MRRLMTKLTQPTKAKTTPKRGQGRSTRTPEIWRARLRMVAAAALTSSILSAGAFCFLSDKPAQMLDTAYGDAMAWSVDLGFYVADVQAIGRNNTATSDILKALNVAPHAPILDIDLIEGQKRIEALPWVKSAQIERHLPNVLKVRIVERIPVAIYQTNNRSMLIDDTGTEIVPAGPENIGMPIVTGRGAAKHVAQLVQDLSSIPDMAKRVRAAVRVGDRRWNLRLDSVSGGIEVRLPEEKTDEAWKQLAELQNTHRILQREVAMIDLRLPDRLVVRLSNGQTLPATHFDRKSRIKRGEASA